MSVHARTRRALAAVTVLALTAFACSDDDDEPAADSEEGSEEASGEGSEGEAAQEDGGGLLQEVQDRGTLVCGVNDGVPGFGVVDDAGEYAGFDIDFCKVIAAAVLGDSEAVEYRPIGPEERFTALASGEIDVLSRNTTWTASRDGTENADFVTTTFYDGQGMMVLADGVHHARRHERHHGLRARGYHHRAEPGHGLQRPRPHVRAAHLRRRPTRSATL